MSNIGFLRRVFFHGLLAMGLSWSSVGWAALLPYPIGAGQRGTVTCLENSSITYDIYLPPGYSRTGPALPILYTIYPSGGGMVGYFQSICSSMNIIVVGLTQSKNGVGWDLVLREAHAVTRDVRQRVLYDPTAEFAGGFSGGGDCAYMFSRMRSQHVAGLFEMAGSMGRVNSDGANVVYYGIDRVQTNLLVARTTGNSDTAAIFYQPFNSNFLATCAAQIRDWSFSGGHAVPSDIIKSNCLVWLCTNRVFAAATDQGNSGVLFTNWQLRIAQGDREGVLRECVSNLMNFPRSWFAYQAQLTLDDLLTNSTAFRTLNVSNLADGYFSADLFYYYARGAATNNNWPRYYSCLKALTGIHDTNWVNGIITNSGIVETVIFPTNNGNVYIIGNETDRAGQIYNLLTNANHYVQPAVLGKPDPNTGQMHLWLSKDMPALAYSIQSRTNLTTDIWHTVDTYTTDADTNTFWSASFDLPIGAENSFFRIKATALPTYYPPSPN